ncbi:MAG: UvrD-helicase domain-containing protein [Candidatus Marinimicrobia bacterium]|nr:UvrD-helicase domain-containing protein [Candidatus Neomarinimicrobiota bacterium]
MNDYEIAKENIEKPFIVSASAGTGKTRVLVERYVNIIKKKHADIGEIIAITFTEKAAGEMKDRIRRAIRNADPSADRNIPKLLDKLNTAPISTIHSFCARVLQDNINEIDIDPQFRIIDEIEETILRKEILEFFLQRKLRTSDPALLTLIRHFDLYQIKDMLNSVWQQQADCSEFLIKLCERTVEDLFLQYKNFHEKYTLKLLKQFFNDPVVKDILERFRSFNSGNSDDTLYQAIMTIFKAVNAVDRNRIPAELWDKSLHKAFSSTRKGRKENWGDELIVLRELVGQLKEKWNKMKDQVFPFNEDIEKQNAALMISFAGLAMEWIEHYRVGLNDKGLIDFNGLEIETERFFKRRSKAARNYANRFVHLLVDEFQDISPVQNRIFEAMIELNMQLITFYVGDEKQSIYRFRGAEVEIFNTHKELKPLLYLDKNFRSLKSLIDFYNRFFTFLFNTQEKKPKYDVDYDKPVESADSTISESVLVELLIVNADDDSIEETNDIKLSHQSVFSSIEAEATHIIQRMKALHKQAIVKEKSGNLRLAEWRDFAILLRSRTHQEKFERVLQKAGIPYYVSSGIGFYERREVLDVINFIRALLNWFDESALIATLRSPMVGISDVALMSFTTDSGLMDGIQKILKDDEVLLKTTNPDHLRRFREFYVLYEKLHEQLAVSTTAELIQQILDETGYLSVLAAFPDEKQSLANVLKLVDLAVEWSTVQEISPVDFIRRIKLYQVMQVREGEANLSSESENSVTIMTIHGAKGLSFPIIIVPRLAAPLKSNRNRLLIHHSDGIALSFKTMFQTEHSFIYRYLSQIDKERSFAEEKRLLYVAATRAESHLILSTVDKTGKKPRSSLWQTISTFFKVENDEAFRKHESTIAELYNDFNNLQPESSVITNHLTDSDKEKILEMIYPIPSKGKIEKVTPTAFASWVSEQSGKTPDYEADSPVETSTTTPGKSLSALEIGTIIHRAFSWWDYQKTDTLGDYVAQLIKPYFLDSKEEKRLVNQAKEWGGKLLHPDNKLYHLLNSAVQIEREIDIYAHLHDTLIEGKIDLLLRMEEDQYVIIDFKSDRIAEYPDDFLMTKYNAQLDLYALMLTRWSKLKVSKSCIYFIRNGLLIEQSINEDIIRRTEERLKLFIQRYSAS